MASFQESKSRYEDVLRKAQEARDAEKKREAEAKARHTDWNGRASNTVQNMTNAATKILGELPVRVDDAREGRGFIALMRTLDDKKHAELKFTFVDDYAKKMVTCKLTVGPDEADIAIDLPEMPASPQPSFDRAKRDMETQLNVILVKFFDRIVAASNAPAALSAPPATPAIGAPAATSAPAASPPAAASATPALGATPLKPLGAPPLKPVGPPPPGSPPGPLGAR